METYYIVTSNNIPSELEWELRKGGIVRHGGNAFYAKNISEAIKGNWTQLSKFSEDIFIAYKDRNNGGVEKC